MACIPQPCSFTLQNTGVACNPIMAVGKKLLFTPTYASDGTLNGIPYADSLDQAYFDNLVGNADKSKRIFPLPAMENVEDDRGENEYETFNSNAKALTQEGSRTFKGWFTVLDSTGSVAPQLVAKINSFRNQQLSTYIVGKDNSLTANTYLDGTIHRPIKIEAQSLNARLIKSKDKETQKIEITFNYDNSETDGDLRTILCENMGDANLLGLRGLLDICAEYSAISQTGFTAKLVTLYGDPKNKTVDVGLVQADFALYNETDNASVTISGMTEDPDGTYAFTFASQTLGDVLTLTPTKAGRDYACVIAAPIQIPAS